MKINLKILSCKSIFGTISDQPNRSISHSFTSIANLLYYIFGHLAMQSGSLPHSSMTRLSYILKMTHFSMYLVYFCISFEFSLCKLDSNLFHFQAHALSMSNLKFSLLIFQQPRSYRKWN